MSSLGNYLGFLPNFFKLEHMEKWYLLICSAHFLIGLLLLLLSHVNCFCILEFNPLLVMLFANILSHSIGCFFILFVASFAVQKLV